MNPLITVTVLSRNTGFKSQLLQHWANLNIFGALLNLDFCTPFGMEPCIIISLIKEFFRYFPKFPSITFSIIPLLILKIANMVFKKIHLSMTSSLCFINHVDTPISHCSNHSQSKESHLLVMVNRSISLKMLFKSNA